MRLREKGKEGVVHYGWDEAQAALQAGTHVVADDDGQGSETEHLEPVEEADGLDGKTRAELDALAAERGVDVSKAKTKDDVIAALRAA
ncbi:hypothetical protein [Methylobacterium pseudosasicola]|uniref:Rho termination factor, N-terminal domain n=1 Tax=Methylobacterium pseudosasicola TaxID=582667 RepID=A0A1I4TI59_9HYPH|nr:hypothetical protein [Methylobacterium pseudosasicola]SFM76345.1 hypothetical protein SAMN05192568_10549 [Methylobacterium pseudosasicola]